MRENKKEWELLKASHPTFINEEDDFDYSAARAYILAQPFKITKIYERVTITLGTI